MFRASRSRERKHRLSSDDLLSNPAVEARDLERIQVPEAPAEAAEAPRAQPAPREPPAASRLQGSLFGDEPSAPGVYPPIAAWASRTSAIVAGGETSAQRLGHRDV